MYIILYALYLYVLKQIFLSFTRNVTFDIRFTFRTIMQIINCIARDLIWRTTHTEFKHI